MHHKRRYLLSAFAAVSALSATAQSVPANATARPDLSTQPTLYVVGYTHLDTEWRWEYPQVIDEYLRHTMEDNFAYFDRYPHYLFNFSGANRYRLMQEYYPQDFARLKGYVAQGRWFPAGASVEEGDVNAPNAEGIFRQILYGNHYFRKTFGVASDEFMLPDCFGFPNSLPSILAHSGIKGFSTQKLAWGSSAHVGGPESLERTPEGTPFNVGIWVGPDGSSVMAGVNPGAYNGDIVSDLSTPLPSPKPNPAMADVERRLQALEPRLQAAGTHPDPALLQEAYALQSERAALERELPAQDMQRFQRDWAARVLNNGKVTGIFADYHYYGTGDTGGAPREESVRRLEAIVTQGSVALPAANRNSPSGESGAPATAVPVGRGPVHVISSRADQMFQDITPEQAARLPRYTGELELTNHSAASLTSQAYQKRWIRKEELLADAAEKTSLTAQWLGGRSYPLDRLNGAWTLAMAAHFHDLAAGTATPRAYEFSWNDAAIAMNQFSIVLSSAMGAVSEGLDTQGEGEPVVVFNQLNIPRQDLVEADLPLGGGRTPSAVRVVGPDGAEVPSQVSGDRVLFAANVPSVGYAVYHLVPGKAEAPPSNAGELSVSQNQLENASYRVTLNSDGDVASIFDKTIQRELLCAPARLALSYDNPTAWPAWNMDWDQEQAAPKEYVSGPATIRVVENGPVRVALEVTRETAGSRFVQTISLAAGDPGKRVEFNNAVDWATRERNLKASFPLSASNDVATYNLDVGTIERTSARPEKFEVPSHQWIDLTDASGEFGATLLTDAKNGSDKPNDHTLRLTLIVTPGTAGGYADQGTQDIGHHQFLYGLAGHPDGWRSAQTDWQGQRLNAPLLAFAAPAHPGPLGKRFSMLKISDDRIRVLGMKKAEDSDELILRMVELNGKPAPGVRVSFAAPVTTAREVNGQEQPLGEAHVSGGELLTSFGAYEPKTFVLKLGPAPATVAPVQSTPVDLHYDLAAASGDGEPGGPGFDGKGDTLPAAMLPAELNFNGVVFHLAPARTGSPDALVPRGQRIALPPGAGNHVYLLAAATGGDQRATFRAGGKATELNIEDWGGYIGQWDDREWSGDPVHGSYGEMTGLRPGFIKRADLAWYASHHHDAAGKNVPYSYSYLFAYSLDLPPGAKTLELPKNDSIRILAMSVATENTEGTPLQPLYDVLPASGSGPADFSLLVPPAASMNQGQSKQVHILLLPRGARSEGRVKLEAENLPSGVTATFSPITPGGASVMTLQSNTTAAAASSQATVVAMKGGVRRTAPLTVEVQPVLKGTTPVDLMPAFNVTAIYADKARVPADGGADGEGAAFAEATLGREQIGAGVPFRLGPAGAPDAVFGSTIGLPPGRFASLRLLATAVEGPQPRQNFIVTYTDGSTSTLTQGVSDWAGSNGFSGESPAVTVPYRIFGDGSVDGNPFNLFAYKFQLDPNKEVRSVSLPTNRNVLVFGVTLVPQGSEPATAPVVRNP